MNHFAPFWEHTLSRFPAAQASPLTPGGEAQRGALSGDSMLTFHDLILPRIGELRATLIEGRNASIFNVMIFPFDSESTPIFASEIVRFGNAIRAAVIDLQPLTPNAHSELARGDVLRQLADVAGSFPSGGPLPGWCAEYFSPGALWSRMENLDRVPDLLAAYQEYLSAWIALAAPSMPHPAEDPNVAEYKRHHIEHSPGLKFLHKLFGAEWTEDFLWHGMYRGAAQPGTVAAAI